MSTATRTRLPRSHAVVEARRGTVHAQLDELRVRRQRARRREATLGRPSLYRAGIDARIDALLDELLDLRVR
jgi:hypothetical protein